jgi:F0F1-type ATP synthase assembly protein I
MNASKNLAFYFLLIAAGQIVVGALALLWVWLLGAISVALGAASVLLALSISGGGPQAVLRACPTIHPSRRRFHGAA